MARKLNKKADSKKLTAINANYQKYTLIDYAFGCHKMRNCLVQDPVGNIVIIIKILDYAN